MNITFDYEIALFSIEQEIARIPKELKGQTRTVIRKISKIVQNNVLKELNKLPDSEALTNYDGTGPYIHMKDDIKVSVKDDQEGSVFAIIRGGKYTGYKWHLVNNGTVKSRATHFIDIAMNKSENEVNQIIDEMIRKAVQ
jgi:HK97 gp10 family phage protein